MRSLLALLALGCTLAPAVADWKGKKVLPKKPQSEIRIGDWVDGKQVYWEPHNLMNCEVRQDRDGFLRVFDGRREGWVDKDDFVTAEDAPAYFDKAVKANPKDAYAWDVRGNSWYQKGEYENAIKDLNESIRLAPTEAGPYNMRGIVWIAKAEFHKAIADFTEAVRLDPNYALAYNNRGVARRHSRDFDKALVDFSEALRIDPKQLDALRNRGWAWAARQEYEKSVADFTAAIKIDPKDSFSYVGRGTAHRAMNVYDRATADYLEAIRLDPKSTWGLNKLCWLLATCPDAKWRNGKKAVEYGKRLIETSSSWSSHDTLAAAHAEAGDFESAVVEQKKAVELAKGEKNLDASVIKDAEARLALYRGKKPHRDE